MILTPDGTVVDTQNLIADDDGEAIALAKVMVDGHTVELWHDLRFIEHFDVESWGS